MWEFSLPFLGSMSGRQLYPSQARENVLFLMLYTQLSGRTAWTLLRGSTWTGWLVARLLGTQSIFLGYAV